jgi:four helix bundle protein
MGAKKFTDLIVWQKAYALSLKIYKLTASFPAEERFRLTDQMRAAAATIPRNIAEGFGRMTPRDQAYFYTVAKSSGDELKVDLMHSRDLGYSSDVSECQRLVDEVCAMLYVLRRRVLSTDRRR